MTSRVSPLRVALCSYSDGNQLARTNTIVDAIDSSLAAIAKFIFKWRRHLCLPYKLITTVQINLLLSHLKFQIYLQSYEEDLDRSNSLR